MEDITKILEGIGVSENEARIYVALLGIGKAGITQIADKSGLKRTTIYSYVNPLLEKGFIKRSIYGKRTYFLAEDPQKLLKIFEKKRSQMIKSMPILESLYSQNSPNPKLEFYEGKNQIKKLYEEIWSSGENIKTFFSPENFYKLFGAEFDRKLNNLEMKAGGDTKDLISNNTFSKTFLKNSPCRPPKLLPKSFTFDADTIIIGNSVVMVSFEPLYAIRIKNKPLADFQRNVFNYFWKVL